MNNDFNRNFWVKISAVLPAFLLYVTVAAGAAELSPPASPLLTDRNGRLLRAYPAGGAAVRSDPVSLEEISPWLVLSTLAAEDRRFFSHPGVDLKAIGRALWQNSKKGRTVSGASTITQQLARALRPRPKTLLGKLGEMFSALRLESGHSKEEILEGYLNSVSYGNRTAGAQAAARAYFGLPARDLTLAQSAALAGVPKSPALYNPVRHPGNFAARGSFILRRMLELGYIDGESYRLAAKEKVSARLAPPPFAAPQFCDFALKNSPGGRGSLATTLDLAVQEHAADSLSNQLARLSRRHNVTNGSVLAIDNFTGGIIAWVGSNDFFDAENSGQVDGVTALRQPGSALKPFLYALALSKGARASDLIEDEPLYAAGGYTPLNYDKKYHGRVRLREALACSYNVPAVRLAEKTGTTDFLSLLKRFGFDSLDKPAAYYGAGLALGNGEVKLLELVNAYAALARGGIWLPAAFEAGQAPSFFLKGPKCGARRACPERSRRVIGANEAYIVTDILSDNAARAEAFGPDSPLNLPFPFAAKTGTTKDYRDNWAVGYTPEWTVGVWVGNFNGSPMRKVSGITGAAPVLREVALKMKELYGSTPFRRPLALSSAHVCAESGLLFSPLCPSVMEELFLPGNMPSAICGMHGAKKSAPAVPASRPKIKYPVDGDIFRIDPNTPLAAQAVFLKASVDDPDTVWRVDSKELPERGPRAEWGLRAGFHRAFFTVKRGGRTYRSAPVRFTVVK
ncbi:MAG: penicillin-binding protein 1C [Elusimicrobia bacterium]|nr:penicillin-binding protein 1C [Elusimicrobiota bacterium]